MRLHLLAHAATEAFRAARFPLDEPLDAGAGAPRVSSRDASGSRTSCGARRRPDAGRRRRSRCRDGNPMATPRPVPPPGLGRAVPVDLAAEDPATLQAWMTDPEAGPPGGESLRALVDRVTGWMDGLPGEDRSVGLAVVDPPVVRAAVAHALGAGPPGRGAWTWPR